MKCRRCKKRFGATLGGIGSSPGTFFVFAIIAGTLIIAFASLGFAFLAAFSGLAVVVLTCVTLPSKVRPYSGILGV